jgi:hypothetical protein
VLLKARHCRIRRGLGPVGGIGVQVAAWKLILLAILGGLILNLMPCVLPVLSMKAFGMVSAVSSGHAGEVRRHGIWYTAGVLISFGRWRRSSSPCGRRPGRSRWASSCRTRRLWPSSSLSCLPSASG